MPQRGASEPPPLSNEPIAASWEACWPIHRRTEPSLPSRRIPWFRNEFLPTEPLNEPLNELLNELNTVALEASSGKGDHNSDNRLSSRLK